MMKLFYLILNILFWLFFCSTSLLYTLIGLVLRFVCAPFDPNRKVLQQFSCFWGSTYIWANPFWSVEVSGKEHVDPSKVYVMVANHQSIVDILCVFRTFLHFKWIAKQEMFYMPFVGWNMWLNGYVVVKRGNAFSRVQCLEKSAQWIQKGSSMFFFPEGRRSRDGQLQEFKVGAFRLAIDNKVDILPVLIEGSLHAVPKHSILLTGKSHMKVKICPPIEVASYLDGEVSLESKRLALDVHDVMKKKLLEVS